MHSSGAGDTSVPHAPFRPLGLAWAHGQHSSGILEWGASVAAFRAAMGARGATQPCQGRFGGSLLRAVWVGTSMYP